MLVSKLLKLEDTLIQEVEDLAKKLPEKENTSFTALVRNFIKTGVHNMNMQINFTTNNSMGFVKDPILNQVLWAIVAKQYQQGTAFKCLHLSDFQSNFQSEVRDVFFHLTEDKKMVKSDQDYQMIGAFQFNDLKGLALDNFIDSPVIKSIFNHIKREFAGGVLGNCRVGHILRYEPFFIADSGKCNIPNCVSNTCDNHKYRDHLKELSDCGVLVSKSSIRNRTINYNGSDFWIDQPSLYIRDLLKVVPASYGLQEKSHLYGDMLSLPPTLK